MTGGQVRGVPAGTAPFQGRSVGVDRRSPVSRPVYGRHRRHRSFRCTGGLRAVTYRPGGPPPYDPETAVAFE